MVKATSVLDKGARRVVRNGVTTRLWLDNWLEAFPLHEAMLEQDLQAKVVDY